jgi:hypothetical protein
MYKLISSAILFTVLFTACNRSKDAGTLPESTGSPAEVFVVSDESIKENVEAMFQSGYRRPSPILIIAENAEKQQFENSLVFYFGRHQSYSGADKHASLILVAEIGKQAGNYSDDLESIKPLEKLNGKEIVLNVYKNVWAKPQTIFRLTTKKTTLQPEDAELLEKTIYRYETVQGLPGSLAPTAYCDSVSRLIDGNYGFNFKFPPQFKLEFSNREVVWLWQETQRFYRHAFFNIFTDSSRIETAEQAIANRNLYTARYLKNDVGTTIKVSDSKLFPLTWEKDIMLGKHKAHVLRGWYTEEGTYRRGPFARYFFHDSANHRYIVLDGFLHAPEQMRLPYYRTFDLMAATIDFK